MPISQNTTECVLLPEKDLVSAQDKELAILYWKLQRKVHTDPTIRGYLDALTCILKERRIRPTVINDVGLELASHNQI